MVETRFDNERRSNRDQRAFNDPDIDRRVFNDPNYEGPERRSGSYRRSGNDRRKSL